MKLWLFIGLIAAILIILYDLRDGKRQITRGDCTMMLVFIAAGPLSIAWFLLQLKDDDWEDKPVFKWGKNDDKE